MNVIIVPGYGDQAGYIEKLTKNWPKRFGLEPHIHPFGTIDPAETYDRHWQEFSEVLESLGKAAVVGISFGASIAARALQDYPKQVNRAVFISGPHRLSDLNPDTVNNKYPMLNKSLPAFNVDALPASKIMTTRPLSDGVIAPKNVVIENATNLRVPVVGHGAGIAAALLLRSKAMSDFLHQEN